MPILNYTSKASAETSLAEITKILVNNGFDKISVDYVNKIPNNLTFMGVFNGQTALYSLPCRFDAVLVVMTKQRVPNSFLNKEQAIRTGWRILKDWVEAQMAIVETEMVDISEVFLPYMVTRGGDRLYDYIKSLDSNESPLMLGQ